MRIELKGTLHRALGSGRVVAPAQHGGGREFDDRRAGGDAPQLRRRLLVLGVGSERLRQLQQRVVVAVNRLERGERLGAGVSGAPEGEQDVAEGDSYLAVFRVRVARFDQKRERIDRGALSEPNLAHAGVGLRVRRLLLQKLAILTLGVFKRFGFEVAVGAVERLTVRLAGAASE